MRKRRLVGLPLSTFLFLLPLLQSLVFAQGFETVFTKQYTHSGGHPDTLSDPFAACDPTGTFKMIVVNGPGGQRLASGGSIIVNGVEVIRVQHKSQVIEKPLSNVGKDNVLEVQRLRGGPGGTIQVTVQGIQRCVGIKITSPAAGSVIQRDRIVVLGQVIGPLNSVLTVTVNGVPAQANNETFGTFIPLELGENTITATVLDPFGNSATDSIAVLRQEPTPPDFFAIWTGLKDALRRGDIEVALSFIVEKSRERYRGIFTALSSTPSDIDSILTDISPVQVRENDAEFEMMRSGRSFHILFARDDDGTWRLATF